MILDKSSSIYGQMSSTNEPNSTPELSPVRGNDGNVEGTVSLSTRILDEVDDDDPFSKRRYKSSNVFVPVLFILPILFFLCTCRNVHTNAFQLVHNGKSHLP